MKPETPIEEFGRQLIVTGDLDPLYIAMVDARLAPTKLKRLLFAYWCFYNAGAASYIADAPTVDDYWGRMLKAAYNTVETPIGGRWPRGHERRHFRGPACVKAVDSYMNLGVTVCGGAYMAPESIVDAFANHPADHGKEGRLPFKLVSKRVQQLRLFGPWMAFKVGDMLERVLGVPVSFDDADVFMFDSPREAAMMQADKHLGARHEFSTEHGRIKWVVDHLKEVYTDLAAPPHFDRPIQLQEVETVLCKWKSSLSGHYPMGLDSRELLEGLGAWSAVSETAGLLLAAFKAFQSGDRNIAALDEALTGIKKCPDCGGTGHSGNLNDELCPTCGGGGRVDRQGTYQDADDHDMEVRS